MPQSGLLPGGDPPKRRSKVNDEVAAAIAAVFTEFGGLIAEYERATRG